MYRYTTNSRRRWSSNVLTRLSASTPVAHRVDWPTLTTSGMDHSPERGATLAEGDQT